MANASKQIVTQLLALNKHRLTFAQFTGIRGRMRTKTFTIAHLFLLYHPHIPILGKRMRSFAICSVFVWYMCTRLNANSQMCKRQMTSIIYFFKPTNSRVNRLMHGGS